MATENEFSAWLSKTLLDLNTDETVFGSYITGILDGDDTLEEKTEALEELLNEIIENQDITKLKDEILERWLQFKNRTPPPKAPISNVDEKLVKLLESQSLATTNKKQYTAEEKKIRDAILNQYSQMTDDEEEDDEGNPTPSTSGSGDAKENGLEKNINALTVANAEKQKREQNREDSKKKKEKDKEDRANQKQLKEDKKEKRKTVKGERRR